MIPSKRCIDLIKKYEGLRLKSYLCPANKWTIGYGSTFGLDNKPIQKNQVITIEMAEKLLINHVNKIAQEIKLNVSQNQFDAIISFCYNLGVRKFNNSTLKKMIVANPNDTNIKNEFLKWVNKGSAFEEGLTKRRLAESNLYHDKNTTGPSI